MKIVIDIPEDDYNAIRDNIKAYSLADMLFGAVQCGIPVYEHERLKGEWLIEPHSLIMKCSLCGSEENAKEIGKVNKDKHYCWNCGAQMIGGAE